MKTRFVLPALCGCCLSLTSLPSSAQEWVPKELPAELLRLPVADRISQAPVFLQPLTWIGRTAPPTTESEALWAGVELMREHGPRAGVEALEAFLESFPGSAWAPSVHNNLAAWYEDQGRYSRSLLHWQAVWEQYQDSRSDEVVALADEAGARMARLLSVLGDDERLEPLLRALEARPLDAGHLSQTVAKARETYFDLVYRVDSLVPCGAVAVEAVLQELSEDDAEAQVMRNVLSVKAPVPGFSLTQLAALAAQYGYDMIPAWRPQEAEFVVPSVVHLSVGHYVALMGRADGRLRVLDPGYRRTRWMSPEDLAEESSGYCLVRVDRLPAGWEAVPDQTASGVVGRGPGNTVDDEHAEGECDPEEMEDECGEEGCVPPVTGPSDGDTSNCTPCSQQQSSDPTQPQWGVEEPYINSSVSITPLHYADSSGAPQSFSMFWKQRGTVPTYNSFNVGNAGWSPKHQARFTLSTSTASDTDMMLPTGGKRKYLLGSYIGSEPGPSEAKTSSRLMVNPAGGGNGIASLLLHYRRGPSSLFAYRHEYWSGYTNFFLTQRTDPRGRVQTYDYTLQSGYTRLTSVQDADGNDLSFSYGNAQYPGRVTQVTDPYGRSAGMAYDGYGRLSAVTNALGVVTTFAYDSTGWITNITTPLGQTSFAYVGGVSGDFSGVNYWTVNRACTVTEPDGSKHLSLYRDGAWATDPLDVVPCEWPSDDVPSGLPWQHLVDYYSTCWRNSYHWTPQQYAAVVANNSTFAASGDPLDLVKADYLRARYRHWLHGMYDYSDVTDTLSHERPASADGGTTLSPASWYDYPERWYEMTAGSSRRPTLIARRMLDGDGTQYNPPSTWATHFERDDWGHVTSRIERWYDHDASAYHMRTNSYEYVNDQDLLVHRGPDGQVETGYTYDQYHPHLPVAITNAVGEVTRYYYDSAQRLTGVARPSGLNSTNLFGQDDFLQYAIDFMGTTPLRTNTYTWSNGQILTHTDPRGLTLTYTRDALGRPTRIDYSDDSTYELFSYTRASDGAILPAVTYHRDRRGGETDYTYTAANRLETVTDPLGRVTTYNYCTCGSPSEVTRAYGTAIAETTTYDHDQVGRLQVLTTPDGASTTNTYDALGRLAIRSDAVGSITNWYDNLGRLNLIQNAAGDVQYLEYDDHDRLLWQTDARTNTISFAYDPLGRLSERTVEADSSTESWGYTSGQAAATAFTNAVGNVTLWAYDARGRKTNEVQVGVSTNSFTWTPSGELATLTDGKGNVTTWQYDAEGRTSEKWYQGQSTADLLYLYDANGQLTVRFTRTGTGASTNGFWTTYAYDAAGQMTNVTYPAGTTSVNLTYDALGRMTQRIDGIGYSYYSYGMPGGGIRTTTEDGPWSSDAVVVTNKVGRSIGLRVFQPSGSWWQAWDYDGAGRWDTAASPAGTFTYQYPGDATTEPIGVDLPGGNWITNRYDARGRLTETALRNSGGTLLNLHGYAYDDASQRTWLSRTNSAITAWSGHTDTAYDAAGQLTKAWSYYTNGNPVTSEQWGYLYDAAQNLNQRTNYVTVETFNVNALNELTSIPGSTPTYDRRGNLIQRGFTGSYQWYYTYDHENRLTEVRTDTYYTSESNRFKEQMVYDGLGRLRIRQNYIWSSGNWSQNGETRYLYAGWLQVQERDGSNVPTVSYTRGRDLSGSLEGAGGIGGLLARSHGYSGGSWTSHVAYHADGNGNITALVDGNGALQGSYRYDRFGRYRGYSGALAAANAMRFSSKPWVGFKNNAFNGLYYYGYRLYDPYLQRWANRDPIGENADPNLYRFVGNTPTTHYDVDGRLSESACQTAVDTALKSNAKAKAIHAEMKKRGCPDPAPLCRDCCGEEEKQTYAGYFDQRSKLINLCSNKFKTGTAVITSLVHEMIHALDDCKGTNWSDCSERACSEIHAYDYGGTCSVGGGDRLPGETYRQCVERRATASTTADPNCTAQHVKDQMSKCLGSGL